MFMLQTKEDTNINYRDDPAFNRIIIVLQKYQNVIIDGMEDQMSVIHKIQEQNKTILDDYIQIISNDINITKSITEAMTPCDIHKCPFIQQYYNHTTMGQDKNSVIKDDEDIIHINLFNFIHCNLLHPSMVIDNETDKGIICKKRMQAKYSLHLQKKHETNLDRLRGYMMESDIKTNHVQSVCAFWRDQEYDTDAIENDIDNNSNLYNLHPSCHQSIVRYFYISKCMSNS